MSLGATVSDLLSANDRFQLNAGSPDGPMCTILCVDVDIDKLTAILAERMAEVVPDGFHVQTSGSDVRDTDRLPRSVLRKRE